MFCVKYCSGHVHVQETIATVIRKILDDKIFSNGQGHLKFIYLKILQYEHLGHK